MSTIRVVFCASFEEVERLKPRIEGLKDATFLDLKSEVLQTIEPGSVSSILIFHCGLQSLFKVGSPKMEIWSMLWEILGSKGNETLTIHGLNNLIKRSPELEDFSLVLRTLNNFFILLKFENDMHTFLKVNTLKPEIVTPEVLNKRLISGQEVTNLFEIPTKREKNMCSIVSKEDDRKLIGGGVDGLVYYFHKWRTDVVIKRIPDIGMVIPNHEPEFRYNVEAEHYKSQALIDVFASSLLNELTTGLSTSGFSMLIPRFSGFFTCAEDGEYSIYLIEEKMDTDLEKLFTTKKLSLETMKVMVWQSLYIMLSLNRLGWMHFDANPRNFFVSKLSGNDYFGGQEVGSAPEWYYKLDDRTWLVKNCGYVSKIADFGYAHHFRSPFLSFWPPPEDPDYRVVNRFRPGVDVGYFMVGLASILIFDIKGFKEFEPLFQTWLELLDVKLPNSASLETAFRNVLTDQPGPLADLFTSTFRITEKYETRDVFDLLDSNFFAEVVRH